MFVAKINDVSGFSARIMSSTSSQVIDWLLAGFLQTTRHKVYFIFSCCGEPV